MHEPVASVACVHNVECVVCKVELAVARPPARPSCCARWHLLDMAPSVTRDVMYLRKGGPPGGESGRTAHIGKMLRMGSILRRDVPLSSSGP